MSNWTELQKLKERVSVLEVDVNALKHARIERVPLPRSWERARGAFIPFPEIDMRPNDKRIPAPRWIRYPDGREVKVRGWKEAFSAVIADVSDDAEMVKKFESNRLDRVGRMGHVLYIAREKADGYALAFYADCDMYPNNNGGAA